MRLFAGVRCTSTKRSSLSLSPRLASSVALRPPGGSVRTGASTSWAMAEELVREYVHLIIRRTVDAVATPSQNEHSSASGPCGDALPSRTRQETERLRPQAIVQPIANGVGLCGSFAAGRGAVWRRIERPGMRHYYYNEELGESRWERPDIEKPNVVLSQETPSMTVASKWPSTTVSLPAIEAEILDVARDYAERQQPPGLQLPLLSFQGRSGKSKPLQKCRSDADGTSGDVQALIDKLGMKDLLPQSARRADTSQQPPMTPAPASARNAMYAEQPHHDARPRDRRREPQLPPHMSTIAHLGRKLPLGLPQKLEVSRNDTLFHIRTKEYVASKLEATLNDPTYKGFVHRNIDGVAKWEPEERIKDIRARAEQKDALLRRAAERHAAILREKEKVHRERMASTLPPVPQNSKKGIRRADGFAEPTRDLSRPLSPSAASSDRHRARLLAAEIRRLS
eukprot:scaffold264194_cov31-Tisochrysis_lutea.AAC.1